MLIEDSSSDPSKTHTQWWDSEPRTPRCQQLAKEDRLGEPIAQGFRSYELVRSLQLGIVFSIARTTRAGTPASPEPEPSAADFAEQARLAQTLSLSSCTERARSTFACSDWSAFTCLVLRSCHRQHGVLLL